MLLLSIDGNMLHTLLTVFSLNAVSGDFFHLALLILSNGHVVFQPVTMQAFL